MQPGSDNPPPFPGGGQGGPGNPGSDPCIAWCVAHEMNPLMRLSFMLLILL